jgi:hypothetical protein
MLLIPWHVSVLIRSYLGDFIEIKNFTWVLLRMDSLLNNGSLNTFQQTRGQQYRSGVFCGPCCARCYAERTKHFATITDVFYGYASISSPSLKRASLVLESAVKSSFVNRSEWLVNQKQVSHRRITESAVERERECSEFSAVKEEGFGWRLIMSSCNWLWVRVIVEQAVNKSRHSIQNPLLLDTEP